jgi:hypothetical protein
MVDRVLPEPDDVDAAGPRGWHRHRDAHARPR